MIDSRLVSRQNLTSFKRKIPVVFAAGRFLADADVVIRGRRLQRIWVMRCFPLS